MKNSEILWIPLDAKVKKNLVRTKAERRFGLQNFLCEHFLVLCIHVTIFSQQLQEPKVLQKKTFQESKAPFVSKITIL